MKENLKLNLFLGQPADSSFLRDVEELRKLKKEEYSELIDLIIGWIPKRSFEAEWTKWSKKISKVDKERYRSTVKALLLIISEYVVNIVNESDLRSDFKKLKLHVGIINHIKAQKSFIYLSLNEYLGQGSKRWGEFFYSDSVLAGYILESASYQVALNEMKKEINDLKKRLDLLFNDSDIDFKKCYVYFNSYDDVMKAIDFCHDKGIEVEPEAPGTLQFYSQEDVDKFIKSTGIGTVIEDPSEIDKIDGFVDKHKKQIADAYGIEG